VEELSDPIEASLSRSSFALLRELMLGGRPVIHLTAYKAPHANFHTLHLSTDHTQIAGLSFDDKKAASEFVKKYLEYTSDPDDELLKLSKGKKKKVKQEKQKTKFKPPKKTEISQPCCFVHVTKLDGKLDTDVGSSDMIELASLLIVNLLPSILDISKFSFSLFSHLSNRFSKAIGPEIILLLFCKFSMAVFSSFVTCTKQHGCEISVFFGGLNFVFCFSCFTFFFFPLLNLSDLYFGGTRLIISLHTKLHMQISTHYIYRQITHKLLD
jgi:hypothetical protein